MSIDQEFFSSRSPNFDYKPQCKLNHSQMFWAAQFIICKNKMYGIDSTLMQKMEMRIRQKIYREMLEEQAKQKRENCQNNKSEYYIRNKTQPNQYEKRYSKPKNIFQQTARGLDHSSTFLPVINTKRARSGMQEQHTQQEPKHSKEYQRYLQRRQKKQLAKSLPFRSNRQPEESLYSSERQTIPNGQSPPQQSDDDMTQLYLQQCEQIISSLKDITLKNSRKVKPKLNKYEPLQTFSANKAPSKSLMAQQQTRHISKSYTPKHYSFSDARTPLVYSSLQIDPTNQFQEYAKPQQIKLVHSPFKQQNTKKQADQLSPFQGSKLSKISVKSDKIKENNRRLSLFRQHQEKTINEQQAQQELKQQKLKNKKQQEKIKNKRQNNNEQISKTKNIQKSSKNDIKDQPKQQKTKDKAEKLKQQKLKEQKQTKKEKREELPQNDLEREQKKQTAIIKYLKKARACGNLLYQKIESHKKTGDQEGEANIQKTEQVK